MLFLIYEIKEQSLLINDLALLYFTLKILL